MPPPDGANTANFFSALVLTGFLGRLGRTCRGVASRRHA